MKLDGTTITVLLYILSWRIVIAALGIVPVKRKPAAATVWLMLIFLVPCCRLKLLLSSSHSTAMSKRMGALSGSNERRRAACGARAEGSL